MRYSLALLFILSWAFSPVSSASVSVGITSGISSLTVAAGETYNQGTGIGLELRPQINLKVPSINSMLNFFYQGRIGSNIGSFPVSRVGTGIVFYPWGYSLQNSTTRNHVNVTQSQLAVFFMGQFTLGTISITDTVNVSPALSFNALFVGAQGGLGIEVPVGNTWALTLMGLGETTLLGGSTDSGNSAGVTMSGFSLLLGVILHP